MRLFENTFRGEVAVAPTSVKITSRVPIGTSFSNAVLYVLLCFAERLHRSDAHSRQRNAMGRATAREAYCQGAPEILVQTCTVL